MDEDKRKLEQIKDRKLKELDGLGIDGKYKAELARKKIE